MQKRDSKSFDSGALYRPEVDDDGIGTPTIERIERNDTKIMLPTPPIRKSAANQSESDSNASNRNKSDTNNIGDEPNDSNKMENEKKPGEENEVRIPQNRALNGILTTKLTLYTEFYGVR